MLTAKKKRDTPDEVIAKYKEAYLAANKSDPALLTYENGWFVFNEGYGRVRFRRIAILDMTGRLRNRIQS